MTNRVLHLALKGDYYREIESGVKQFEYRLRTPYWRTRLEGREYDRIELTLGYPKGDDPARPVLVRRWAGYELQTLTHPHFGDHAVDVYAIRVTEPVPPPRNMEADRHEDDTDNWY